MATLFTILGGLVGLIGAALPIFFKLRKHYGKPKEIRIAGDDPRRAALRERLRKRLPNKSGEDDGKV